MRNLSFVVVAVFLAATPASWSQTPAPATTSSKKDGASAIRSVTRSAAPAPSGYMNRTMNRGMIGNSNVVRRVHIKIQKENEQEFITLVRKKTATADEIRIIGRLSREQQALLARVEKDLSDEYAIKPGANYQYDVASKTIFVLSGRDTDTIASTQQAGASASSKKLHMIIDKQEKATKFLQLTSMKQNTIKILQSLAMLSQEKEQQLMQNNSALLKQFSMSRDRSYEHDAQTGTLYELIPVPAAEKTGNK